MSQIKIFLYANCSSCKNAEAVLNAAGVDYERRDIFKDRLSVGELDELFRDIGKRPNELLSRRSIPYRELGLADRVPSDGELMDLMSRYPGLLRRPIIISPDAIQIGFNRSALETLAQRYAQG